MFDKLEESKKNWVVTVFRAAIEIIHARFPEYSNHPLFAALPESSFVTDDPSLVICDDHPGFNLVLNRAADLKLYAQSLPDMAELNPLIALLQNINIVSFPGQDDLINSIVDELKKDTVVAQQLKQADFNIKESSQIYRSAVAFRLGYHDQTQLDLNGQCISACGAKAIVEMLKAFHSLGSLDLSYNRTTDAKDIVYIVAEAARAQVTKVSLAYNQISPSDTVVIATLLAKSAELADLNLSGNHIDPQSAMDVATRLAHSKKLTKLDLADNYIGPKGAIGIATTLANSAVRLTYLNLGHNHLGSEGARGVAMAFAKVTHDPSLLDLGNDFLLDLDSNNIDLAGAMDVAKTLADTNTSLYLGANNIDAAGEARVGEILSNTKATASFSALKSWRRSLQEAVGLATYQRNPRLQQSTFFSQLYTHCAPVLQGDMSPSDLRGQFSASSKSSFFDDSVRQDSSSTGASSSMHPLPPPTA